MSEKNIYKCNACGKEYTRPGMFAKHKCPLAGQTLSVNKVVARSSDDKCTCKYCGKKIEFSKFAAHHCTKNSRLLGTREFMIGMHIWVKACIYYGMRQYTPENQPIAFIRSSQFKMYIKLAEYITSRLMVDQEAFINHLFANNIPQRKWTTEETYENWVNLYLLSEQPTEGISRSINSLVDWQNGTGNPWNTMFEQMSIDRFMIMLRNGYISPWLIYSFPSSSKLLNRLSQSEMKSIYKFINPDIWNSRRVLYREEIRKIQQTFKGVW